jgi:hypothetical protein
MAESDQKKTGRDKTSKKRERGNRQRDGQGEVLSAVLNIWVLGGGFAVALSIGLFYWSNHKHVMASYWFAGAGMLLVLASLIQVLPYAYKWDEGAVDADDSLRPYVNVSSVRGTFEIGKPISVLLKFTNSGKSPAYETEILLAFEKIPSGTRISRTYAGGEFENPSTEIIGIGNTVEISKSGHEWTLEELMQVTTNKSHKIVAHGLVRYRSKHIASGVDETPFCYEFDPDSGGMAACRRNTLPGEQGQQVSEEFKLANQQWLEFGRWAVRLLPANADAPERLDITFEVINPSNMLVKLQGTVGGSITPQNWDLENRGISFHQTSLGGHILAPRRSERLMAGMFPLTHKANIEAFNKNSLRLTISSNFDYIDAFDQQRSQPFGAIVTYGPNFHHVLPHEMGIQQPIGLDSFGRTKQQREQDQSSKKN